MSLLVETLGEEELSFPLRLKVVATLLMVVEVPFLILSSLVVLVLLILMVVWTFLFGMHIAMPKVTKVQARSLIEGLVVR